MLQQGHGARYATPSDMRHQAPCYVSSTAPTVPTPTIYTTSFVYSVVRALYLLSLFGGRRSFARFPAQLNPFFSEKESASRKDNVLGLQRSYSYSRRLGVVLLTVKVPFALADARTLDIITIIIITAAVAGGFFGRQRQQRPWPTVRCSWR